LARLYLMLERTDYPALQCYRRVCDAAAEMPPEFCRDLTRLLRRDGRTDAWVQQFYRRAIGPLPAAPEAPPAAAPIPGTEPGRAVYDAPVDAAPPDGEFRISVTMDEVQDEEGEGHPSVWVRPAGGRRRGNGWPASGRNRRGRGAAAPDLSGSAAAMRAVVRPQRCSWAGRGDRRLPPPSDMAFRTPATGSSGLPPSPQTRPRSGEDP
jgi:hypothetical protein